MSVSLFVNYVSSSLQILRSNTHNDEGEDELQKQAAVALYLWRYAPSSCVSDFLSAFQSSNAPLPSQLQRGAILCQLAALASSPSSSSSATTDNRNNSYRSILARYLLTGSNSGCGAGGSSSSSSFAIFPPIPFQPPFLGENIRTAERTSTEVLHAIVRSVMLDCSLPMTDQDDREKIGEDNGGNKNRKKQAASRGEETAAQDQEDREKDGLNKLANQRQKKHAQHQEEIAKLLGKKKDSIMTVLRRGGLVRPAATGVGEDPHEPQFSIKKHSPLAALEFMMATPDQQRWKILQILLTPETSPFTAVERRHLTAILCFFAASCDHRTPYVLPDQDKSKPVSLDRKLLLELNNFGFVYPIKWKVEEDGPNKGRVMKGFLVPKSLQNALVPSPSEQLQAERQLLSKSLKRFNNNNQKSEGSGSSALLVNEDDDDDDEDDDEDLVRLTRGLELIPPPNALLNTINANGIILETNFRLYAYLDSDSPLLGIICYFARLEVCLNHMYVFAITRHSYMRGLGIGLNTSLILHFLEVNSHPAMRNAASLAMKKRLQDEEASRGRTAALAIQVDDNGADGKGKRRDSQGRRKQQASEIEEMRKKHKWATKRRLARLTDRAEEVEDDAGEEDDEGYVPHLGIIPDSLVDQFLMWEKEHQRLTIVDEEAELLVLPSVEAAEAIIELIEEHHLQQRSQQQGEGVSLDQQLEDAPLSVGRGKRGRQDEELDEVDDQERRHQQLKKKKRKQLPDGVLYHKDVKIVVTTQIFNDCLRKYLPAKERNAKKTW